MNIIELEKYLVRVVTQCMTTHFTNTNKYCRYNNMGAIKYEIRGNDLILEHMFENNQEIRKRIAYRLSRNLEKNFGLIYASAYIAQKKGEPLRPDKTHIISVNSRYYCNRRDDGEVCNECLERRRQEILENPKLHMYISLCIRQAGESLGLINTSIDYTYNTDGNTLTVTIPSDKSIQGMVNSRLSKNLRGNFEVNYVPYKNYSQFEGKSDTVHFEEGMVTESC